MFEINRFTLSEYEEDDNYQINCVNCVNAAVYIVNFCGTTQLMCSSCLFKCSKILSSIWDEKT